MEKRFCVKNNPEYYSNTDEKFAHEINSTSSDLFLNKI